MIQEMNLWLIGGGVGIGLVFGAIVQRSRFCVLAAVSNWVLMRDLRQAYGYLMAVGIAIAGTAMLELNGLVSIAETGFRGGRIDWLGTLAGGTLFGVGTVFAGGCAGRLLVRGAEGSAGAWVALIAAGVSAAACAYGVLEPLRTALAAVTAIEPASGNTSLAGLLGLPPVWVVASVVGLLGLMIFIGSRRHETSFALLLAGAVVGALVVAGWWVSGSLAYDAFESSARPVSLTFVGPLAQTTQLVASGEQRGSEFHLALLVGTLVGAVVSALVSRQFRWTGLRAGEFGRAIFGGSLVGAGAVLAGGCNIGQGLTGMSTLSVSAVLAVAGIATGMRLGLAWLSRLDSTEAVHGSRLAAAWKSVRTLLAHTGQVSVPTKVAGCCN